MLWEHVIMASHVKCRLNDVISMKHFVLVPVSERPNENSRHVNRYGSSIRRTRNGTAMVVEMNVRMTHGSRPACISHCIASRFVDEGGQKEGLVACATMSGVVGVLADEMIGPAFQVTSIICVQRESQYTYIMSANGEFSEYIRPIAD